MNEPEQRRPVAPAWRRFHRTGDFLRNPIVIGVAVVLISNALWAGGVYAWNQGNTAIREYYRSLGHAYVEQALRTNNPAELHELIQRVQQARAPQ